MRERHYENAHIPTVAVDFSRKREQELSILKTFVRLNVLDHKRTVKSDQ